MAVLLGVAYLVAMALQLVSDHGLKLQEKSVYEDWDAIVKGTVNADLVIVGSSRGYTGYNPMIIGDGLKMKAHNLSFNAGGYKLQERKLDIYLKNNATPKIIVQNIDLAHFSENRMLPDESQFITSVNNPDVNGLISSYDVKFEYINYIPLLKYNQNFKLLKSGLAANFRKTANPVPIYSGFYPKRQSFKVDNHNLQKLLSAVKDSVSYTAKNKIKLEYIVKNYKSVIKEDAILILVWAPEHRERLKKTFDPLKQPLLDKLKQIDSENENIYFIDLSHDEMSQNSGYYYDTFHLNDKGADVFSKKLSDEISNIMINRKNK